MVIAVRYSSFFLLIVEVKFLLSNAIHQQIPKWDNQSLFYLCKSVAGLDHWLENIQHKVIILPTSRTFFSAFGNADTRKLRKKPLLYPSSIAQKHHACQDLAGFDLIAIRQLPLFPRLKY